MLPTVTHEIPNSCATAVWSVFCAISPTASSKGRVKSLP